MYVRHAYAKNIQYWDYSKAFLGAFRDNAAVVGRLSVHVSVRISHHSHMSSAKVKTNKISPVALYFVGCAGTRKLGLQYQCG